MHVLYRTTPYQSKDVDYKPVSKKQIESNVGKVKLSVKKTTVVVQIPATVLVGRLKGGISHPYCRK